MLNKMKAFIAGRQTGKSLTYQNSTTRDPMAVRPIRDRNPYLMGLNPSGFIFDERPEHQPRNLSLEGGSITAEMMTDLYERMQQQHGRPVAIMAEPEYRRSYEAQWKQEYNSSVSNDKYQRDVDTLRSQLSKLEDENITLREEVEYYKMLAMEN